LALLWSSGFCGFLAPWFSHWRGKIHTSRA
jgi:hypothetical protein